jgi:hypothetical protein
MLIRAEQFLTMNFCCNLIRNGLILHTAELLEIDSQIQPIDSEVRCAQSPW